MANDKFFIAPYDKESGLVKNVKPWLIPDEAFSNMENAYVYRGRVRKRFGSEWLDSTQDLTRLRILVDTSDGGGTSSGIVPGASGAIGQMFSIGQEFFTVNALGTPTVMLDTGSASTKQFNTTTGAFVFTGVAALTKVYFYPALPVMGLISYEQATVNDEITVAFDTKYSYIYTVGWDRISAELTPGAATWHGTDSQFFWGASFRGALGFDYDLFVTNFNAAEPNYMRVLFRDQMTNILTWDNYRPLVSVFAAAVVGPPAKDMVLGIYIDTARIIVPFQGYLLMLNTVESEQVTNGGPFMQRAYPFRVRWNDGINAFPVDNAGGADQGVWRQDIPGRGSGLDLPFNQSIITVEFIKDRLIIFCESSTWELVYTANKVQPFRFQQINTELGAESTFSIVPFDKICVGVGNVGIMACNGQNVERIDESIPDEVFAIHNSDAGIERVYGIRDYFTEMVWWTFPDPAARPGFPYPTRVLVYNYKNGTWSINDDSITVFGYFQPQTGITWDSTTVTWDDAVSWDSGSLQALFKTVIAGNQEGWTFLINSDIPTNAPALQITDITIPVPGSDVINITAINHNLNVGDFVYLQDITGTGNLTLLNNQIYKIVIDLNDPNNFQIVYDKTSDIIAGVYSGGGTIARVSQIDIRTKEYNFYLDQGRNVYVSEIKFQVDATAVGEIQVDYFVSTSDNSMLADSAPVSGTGAILGTGTLETFPYPSVPFEADASRLIHNYYLQANGEFIQLQLSMNDEQMMRVTAITDMEDVTTFTGPTFMDFQMHSMCFVAKPTGRNQ